MCLGDASDLQWEGDLRRLFCTRVSPYPGCTKATALAFALSMVRLCNCSRGPTCPAPSATPELCKRSSPVDLHLVAWPAPTPKLPGMGIRAVFLSYAFSSLGEWGKDSPCFIASGEAGAQSCLVQPLPCFPPPQPGADLTT